MANSNQDPCVGKQSVNEGAASRTALTAALMRAVHTRLDRRPLIDDPWGDRLVSAAEKAVLYRRILDGADPEARTRLETLGSQQAVVDAVLRAHETYGSVIIRSRCAEDALERAVARGVRQYVLVGAGFDSFIVRQPAFARDVDVYEIDHPASQAMKRRRLRECGVALPSTVHFVPADLSREPLSSVLAQCGLSRVLPAFFSWLGVTIYLSREANLATLRGIAVSSATESEVVFTYADQRGLEGGRSAKLEKMRADRAAQGEPWLSGFDPATLASELSALGLALVEDLGSAELKERYCAGRTDGLSPGRIGHIARAEVVCGADPEKHGATPLAAKR
jgi:methyltransferase (TIGR00027 family)